MAGVLWNFTKTFFIPAFIALVIYVLLTYVVLPLYRQHHQRYAQYLPLGALTERTSSVWTRSYHGLLRLLPASWRVSRSLDRNRYGSTAIGDDEEDGGLYDEEDGEGLVGLEIDEMARDALAQGSHRPDTQRRLSRDLEEGFRDDSDDEEHSIHTAGRSQ